MPALSRIPLPTTRDHDGRCEAAAGLCVRQSLRAGGAEARNPSASWSGEPVTVSIGATCHFRANPSRRKRCWASRTPRCIARRKAVEIRRSMRRKFPSGRRPQRPLLPGSASATKAKRADRAIDTAVHAELERIRTGGASAVTASSFVHFPTLAESGQDAWPFRDDAIHDIQRSRHQGKQPRCSNGFSFRPARPATAVRIVPTRADEREGKRQPGRTEADW